MSKKFKGGEMRVWDKVKHRIAEEILAQTLRALGYTSPKNYGKIAIALNRIAKTDQHRGIGQWFAEWVSDENAGGLWLRRVLRDLHPNVRRIFIARSIVNLFFRDPKMFDEYRRKYGYRPPAVMLISPTMRCNYRCEGCYAAKYTKKDDMPFELFDRVITEAKELGIRFIVILGGEPFIYPRIMDIFRKHRDIPFQVYTNGSLIDEALAKELARLGNVAPQISIEGFEEETDRRRGKGVFRRALRAMEYLRDAGCILAFSAMVTRYNVDALVSESFIDLMIDKGCFYGWYFLYMPVGDNPDLSLMPTPEQRNRLRIFTKEIRKKKPILVADFWNDAPATAGCINGARAYFHINHKGDVEPCIFVHFATDNIKDKPLAEALNSPFFRALRRMQPFSYNTLRPCPVIDHPRIMRTVIRLYGARPTHEGAESLLDGEIARGLDEYAEKVKELYDPIWEKEYEEWAGKWEEKAEFPPGRIETRRKGYYLKREKARL